MREPLNPAAASCAANDNFAETEPKVMAWPPEAEAEDRFSFATEEPHLLAPVESQP